jgi:hypothetical protein
VAASDEPGTRLGEELVIASAFLAVGGAYWTVFERYEAMIISAVSTATVMIATAAPRCHGLM